MVLDTHLIFSLIKISLMKTILKQKRLLQKKQFKTYSLFFLLIFLFTSQINAQNFRASVKSTIYPEVDKILSEYKILEINADNIADYLDGQMDQTTIALDLGVIGNFTYNLKHVELTNTKGVLNDGIRTVPLSRSLTFQGTDHQGNTVAFSGGEKFLMIMAENYFIEPLSIYKNGENQNLFIFYRQEHVIPNTTKKCGVTHVANVKNGTSTENLSSTNSSECVNLDMAIAVDYSMYADFGLSTTAVMDYINGIYNAVQLDFNQFCISYSIVEYFIHTTSPVTNPWPESNGAEPIDADILLSEFCDWTTNCPSGGNSFTQESALNQIWTNKNVQFLGSASTVGLASVGVVCNEGSNCSLIEDFSTNATVIKNVVTHELGHNFNVRHNYAIGDACDPPGRTALVMDPIVSGVQNICWSNGTQICALNSTLTLETHRDDVSCLSPTNFAGTNIDSEACIDETTPISLADFLVGEDTGGTWTVNTGGSSPASGFNSAAGTFTPDGNVAGNYIFDYTVDGPELITTACPNISDNSNEKCDVTTSVTITLIDLMPGTEDASPTQICNNGTVENLGDYLSSEMPGGAWSETSGVMSTGGAFNAGNATFNPDGQAIGFYTFDYTKTGTVIPALTPLNCSVTQSSTSFSSGSGAIISNLVDPVCNPDSRVSDCGDWTITIEITNFSGDENDLFFNIRDLAGCSNAGANLNTSKVILDECDTDIIILKTEDFPNGFNPFDGFCILLFDNSGSTTNPAFDATFEAVIPGIPASGCAEMSSTVTLEIIDCLPSCPTENIVNNDTGTVCTGDGTDDFDTWSSDVSTNNPLDASQDPDNLGSIVFSSVVPVAPTTAPDGFVPDGNHSGIDNCAAETQTTSAYLYCDADDDGTVNTGDTYNIISTYSLTVYPDIQTPTIVVSGCMVTVTGACPGDIITLSGQSVATGMITNNGSNEVTYTATTGDAAGTVNIDITSGISGSTCTFTTINQATPACPACMLMVSCPPTPVNLSCITQLPDGSDAQTAFTTAGGSVTMSCTPAGGLTYTINDSDDGATGCTSDPRTITRSFTITDPLTSEATDCIVEYIFIMFFLLPENYLIIFFEINDCKNQ